MLNYTGHPFLDVGLATILSFTGKEMPNDIDKQDLISVADFIKVNYYKHPLKKYLSIIINNSPYTQGKISDEKKNAYHKIFTDFDNDNRLEKNCVFFNKKALSMAYRHHVPLLSGEGVINFSAKGNSGIPISSEAGLCLQAMILGTIKCQGRVLLVHSNDDGIIKYYANKNLQEHRKLISLNKEEYEEIKYPKTIVLDTLEKICKDQKAYKNAKTNTFIDVYYFTNYGTSPDIDIYHLPMNHIEFFIRVNTDKYSEIWKKIVNRAWSYKVVEEGTGKNKTKKIVGVNDQQGFSKNYLYEDFFEIINDFKKAQKFIRTYFLRTKTAKTFIEDQRSTYSLKNEINLISWNITELFIKEVLEMDKVQIDAIKRFADRMASHIVKNKDSKLFKNFYYHTKNYSQLRSLFIKASERLTKQQSEPIITFDDFVQIFEYGDNIPYDNWRLARDLITIRLIEKIHQENKELLENTFDESVSNEEDVLEHDENKIVV